MTRGRTNRPRNVRAEAMKPRLDNPIFQKPKKNGQKGKQKAQKRVIEEQTPVEAMGAKGSRAGLSREEK